MEKMKKKLILTKTLLFLKQYARHFQKYYFTKQCLYELVSQCIHYKLTITKPSNFVLKLCCVKEDLLLRKIVLILFFRSHV